MQLMFKLWVNYVLSDRGKIWPTYDAQEGVFFFFFTFVIQLLFPDSGKTPWRGGVPLRWTPMEWWFRWVFLLFLILVLTKGKWGWCQASCYDEQLVLEGDEYCGNHSKCVNNDDDTRGLTCECDSGYTAHKMHFGMESYQEYLQMFYEQGAKT